ncbi:amidohydrolase family protein [Actinophytocola sediminis]
MTAGVGWVDVHHHSYHPELAAALRRHGITEMAPGVPVPTWTLADSLRVMDGNGIDAAVLSVLLPDPVAALPGGQGGELVRLANELSASVVRDRPDRFATLLTLPLPDVPASLAEIAHGFDELGADGVVVSAGLPGGLYLGDPTFEPVLAELDRRAAVVFLHPNPSSRCSCRGGPELTSRVPPPLVEFVMDTTRAVAQLVFSGALRRYPRLRVVLAHAGGTIPYLSWRLELASTWVLAGRDGGSEDVGAQLAGLYYETAQSAGAGALACLRAVTDDAHILFGTDFPFMTDPVVAATRRRIGEAPGLDQNLVGRDNVLALFPRLAAELEVGQRAPS